MADYLSVHRWLLCFVLVVVAFASGVVEAGENSRDETCYADSGPEDIVGWIRSHSGFVDERLEISTGPDPSWNVRGIFATASINAFETIAIIPWSLTFTGDKCSIVQAMVHEVKKGRCSKFWPYMRVLQEYDSTTLPAAWSQEERSMLDGLPKDGESQWLPHLDEYAIECNRTITDPDERKATLDFIARANGVLTPSGDELLQMVPFQDSFNHHGDEERSIQRISLWDEEIRIQVPRDIEKGQQIFLFFGRGTARMFGNYGFIEPLPRQWSIPSPGFRVHEFGVEMFYGADYPVAFRDLLVDVDVEVRGPSTRNGNLAILYRKTFVGDLKRALENSSVTFVARDSSKDDQRDLTISNKNSDSTARVYWLSGDGEQFQYAFEPGKTRFVNTFVGHQFRAKVVSNEAEYDLATYTVSSSHDQHWDLSSGISQTSEDL